jgi:hypothetical protein
LFEDVAPIVVVPPPSYTNEFSASVAVASLKERPTTFGTVSPQVVNTGTALF